MRRFSGLGVAKPETLCVPELEALGVESNGHPADRHDGPHGGLRGAYRFGAPVAALAFPHALRQLDGVTAGQTPLHQPVSYQEACELSVHGLHQATIAGSTASSAGRNC